MNPFIEKQLSNYPATTLSRVSSTVFYMPKVDKRDTPLDLEQNHFYAIEVADYIINPYQGFTLHDDWNGGVKPTCKNMQVEVVQIIGKMVKVNAIGEDGLLWSGWLPRKSITIKHMVA